MLLEWTGFDVDGRRDGHLGLGFDVALGCLSRSALDGEALAHLKRAASDLPEARPGATTLLPPEADAFFRAERLRPGPPVSLEPGFSILVAVAGERPARDRARRRGRAHPRRHRARAARARVPPS